MLPPATYITEDDLRATFNPGTWLTIFDDDNDGKVVPGDPNVTLVIQRAHSEVLSYLPRIYDQLPEGVPTLLQSAELDYAFCLAMDRHPEFGRTYGNQESERRWKRAEEKMERLAEAVQQLTDHAPAPRPGVLAPLIFDHAHRVIVNGPNGEDNGGDF